MSLSQSNSIRFKEPHLWSYNFKLSKVLFEALLDRAAPVTWLQRGEAGQVLAVPLQRHQVELPAPLTHHKLHPVPALLSLNTQHWTVTSLSANHVQICSRWREARRQGGHTSQAIIHDGVRCLENRKYVNILVYFGTTVGMRYNAYPILLSMIMYP